MNAKYETYEKHIKELGQAICLDRGLNNAEVVSLLGLMKQCSDTAIGMIAGRQSRKVRRVLKGA